MAERFTIDIGGQAIAGLRGVPGPRALVIALHGGGYEARYWHSGEGSEASLLDLGAALGFEVVAVDRPGYLGSAGPDPRGFSMAEQADLMFRFIETLAPGDGRPVYLIGHSMGGILAVTMAADARGGRLAAIDVSGVPLRYPPEMQSIIDRAAAGALSESTVAEIGDQGRRWMFYGADGSFDPAVAASVNGGNPVPANEMADAFAAPTALPRQMERVAIPVQWTIAEQERSSVGGAPMLDYARSLLGACPHLTTTLQAASGHNISLHHVARAYHLRALAFFDECRALFPASAERIGS
jgi:pimeloyl-ACP methyl ester carboxylesterase